MCVYSYTDHLGCGHRRIHVKLPCPNAFDSSLPQCDPKDYEQGEMVDTECPECEPAFDNQSPLERQTSSLHPKGRIMQEVYAPTKIKLTFSRRPTLRQKSPSPEMEDDTHHFTGDLAQIDQQHNQFRRLTPYDLTSHKIDIFSGWNNDPKQPGPGREEDYTNLPPFLKYTGISVIPTEPWSQPEHNTNHAVSQPRSRRQLAALTSEERRRFIYGYKIALPPPPPTPSKAITKKLSFRIKHGRILTARLVTLSTSQREAMARAGYKDVRSLCVKTRRRIPQDSTPDEEIISSRRTTLSKSQRKVMARAGYHNVRKLSVIRRRRQDPSSEAEI